MRFIGFLIGAAGVFLMLVYFDVENVPLYGFLLFAAGLLMLYFGGKSANND